jgi:BioD-like phosphotransacetylase family protein
MKTLYIPSLQSFSGKTAVCLALGRRLQQDGYRVGYFKPLSTQMWEPIPGQTPDEDADFVRRTLGLEEPTEALIGVRLTPSLLRDTLCGCLGRDLMAEVRAAYERVAAGRDVVLVEGGASLREGVGIGLGPAEVADALGAAVLPVIPFYNEMNLVDDCAVAQLRLGPRLLGVLVNGVPKESWDFVQSVARPCLEGRGIRVLGVIPREERLRAISVGELAQVLGAEFLTLPERSDVLVENLVVGAMGVDQALPRIRRIPSPKAVITGGDRADIQWAALETTVACLVLNRPPAPAAGGPPPGRGTGHPRPPGPPEHDGDGGGHRAVFGKTRLAQPEKLARFEALMAEHFDFARLYQELRI